MGLARGEHAQTWSLFFHLLWQPSSRINNQLDRWSRISTSALQREGDAARPLTETLPTPVTTNPIDHPVASPSFYPGFGPEFWKPFAFSASRRATRCRKSSLFVRAPTIWHLLTTHLFLPRRSWSWSKECTISWRARNTSSWLTT